jgi:hypothetical protein
MKGSPARLYPFVLAVIPVLHLAAVNPGQWRLGDLAEILAAILAGCAVLYGVTALLAGGRWGGRLPPLTVLAAAIWFWGYVHLADLLGRRGSIATHLALLPIGLAATGGAIWWLLRRPPTLDRVAVFLTLVGVLVAGWSGLSIVRAELRSARALRESSVVRRLARPIAKRPGAPIGPQRDIYLIVLDEYANADVTGPRYGFDNREFLDSLRQLGFVVPVVHSNYLHTVLSIPSLLNASQVADLSRDIPWRTVDPTVPNYLVENNRAVRFLKSEGYRFAFFPSFWWLSTRHNRHADLEADVASDMDPVWVLGRSDFRRNLRLASMLDLLHREDAWHAADGDHVIRTFAALAKVPAMPGPVFAFAHVLSPHQPITFDRNCRRRRYGARELGTKHAAGYVQQIECLDRMVLKLVTRILRESDMPPVILLQGDHGASTPAFDTASTAAEIPPESAHERLGAFGAYYLPGHGASAFGDTVTVVNVLGNVLRYYLDADLPRAPDDMYLSTYQAPYVFRRVDPAWLARADSGARAENDVVQAASR